MFQIPHIAAFYLAGKKSGKYDNKLQYELSLLLLLIYSCTAVSYPSLFIRMCLVTLYYWYQMNIRNSIWIGHLKIINIRELEIQYSQALAKPKQETNSCNGLLEALSYVQSDSLCILFSRFFIVALNPPYRNINSTTILVHRTTVHMWRWFHGLWRKRAALCMWPNRQT